ncbi:MAG: (4Fe-4S)-binding protein [Gemmatimonadota bacterium]
MAKIHEYAGKDITVTYDVELCIHAAECVRGLPAVFNPDNRPWIDPNAASADQVSEAIGLCPTGALDFIRPGRDADAVATEDGSPTDCATIDVTPNGPLLIAGDITLGVSSGGDPVKATRVALCRCGHSSNKPYCDGSHAAAGFVAG